MNKLKQNTYTHKIENRKRIDINPHLCTNNNSTKRCVLETTSLLSIEGVCPLFAKIYYIFSFIFVHVQ